jgi:hypothetical protein
MLSQLTDAHLGRLKVVGIIGNRNTALAGLTDFAKDLRCHHLSQNATFQDSDGPKSLRFRIGDSNIWIPFQDDR